MTNTERFGRAAFTRFSFREPRPACAARARGILITATATLSLLLVWAGPSAAQSSQIYNNLNQSTDGTCGTEFDLACAQRFVAGPGTITAIDLSIYALSADGGTTFGTPTVSIYTDDSVDVLPSTLYASLSLATGASVPLGEPGDAVQFDATGVTFDAYTPYWVVLTGVGDVEWAYTYCPPGGGDGCDAATVPGDPNSAGGFMTFADDSTPTGLAFYTTSGTQQMEIDATPEPSTIFMALGGLALVLGAHRRAVQRNNS